MKKSILLAASFMLLSLIVIAQDEEEEEKRPFKENLFTGGSISLQFFNNTFMVGGNPVFGYSLTNWTDVGIVVNYNYTSYRDPFNSDYKLRQTTYGGGAFVKLYPVRFLFVQAQYEHNFIKQKEKISGGGPTIHYPKFDAGSFLVGGGYTTGREGRGGQPFFYLAVLFDVSGDQNSPYTDNLGRTIPIVRGGLQIPLFQGQQGRRR
jgi:hypothetical protein